MNELEKYEEEECLRRGYSEIGWSAIQQRLNLQMLGTFIRNGCCKTFTSCDSFQKREQAAFDRLEKLVQKTCTTEEIEEILHQVLNYSDVVEEIDFNLGLKAGVTLQGKLTDTFETDV